MKKLASLLLIGASFALSANSALAADIIEPPMVIEQPEPVVVESSGGWYIRGDVDYHMRFICEGVDHTPSAAGPDAFDLRLHWTPPGRSAAVSAITSRSISVST
jgi:hypothetical protein